MTFIGSGNDVSGESPGTSVGAFAKSADASRSYASLAEGRKHDGEERCEQSSAKGCSRAAKRLKILLRMLVQLLASSEPCSSTVSCVANREAMDGMGMKSLLPEAANASGGAVLVGTLCINGLKAYLKPATDTRVHA